MFADEFGLRPDLIHLNHAAVAPWPRRTCQAIERFTLENHIQGSQNYPGWMEVEQGLREQLRRLINAPSADDIALLKNTSEGLSVIAHGLDWQPGDTVVSTAREFPSNRIVWESLADQGVRLKLADIDTTDAPEAAILALLDERTRLLSVSSVQYASGLVLDLAMLGQACRERGVLFCVDAIQSLGALPFDVQTARADFVVADGHKWMLAPEGLALFYCRADLREQLTLRQFGWHMVQAQGDFDRRDWAPADSARRFECGSPNMLGIHALSASLSLLEDVGMESISRNVINNSRYIIDYIKNKKGYDLLTPDSPGRFAGIVTFRAAAHDAPALFTHLRDAGVLCAARGGGIRFSPHFYTARSDMDRALALLP